MCSWCDDGWTGVQVPGAVQLEGGGYACGCAAGADLRARAQQRRAARALDSAAIPAKYSALTLDTWKQATHKCIEHTRAHTAVRQWLDKQAKPWLMVRGATGRGKTGLMCGALRHMLDNGRVGRFVCTMDMFDELKARFGGDTGSYLQALASVEVLAIDELVPPFSTDWRAGILFELIYRRDAAQLVTMFTSCATNEEIERALTTAGARRLVENSVVVEVGGKEIRHISR